MIVRVIAIKLGYMTGRRRVEKMGLWYEKAGCLNLPMEIFFPEVENVESEYDEARKFCDGCLVRVECLSFALKVEQNFSWSFGMYGGKSPMQRRVMLAKKVTLK